MHVTDYRHRLFFLALLCVPLGFLFFFSLAAFRLGTPGFQVDKTQHGLHISRIFSGASPVRPGDVIVSINGLSHGQVLGYLVNPVPVSSSREDSPALTLTRGGERIVCFPALQPLSWTLYLSIAWPHLLLIVLFLVLAVTALLRAAPEQPVLVFYCMLCGFSTTIASTLPSHFGLLDPAIISWSFLTLTISNWLSFAGFAHFICVFPRERDLCAANRWLVPVLYLIQPAQAVIFSLATSGSGMAFFCNLQRFRNLAVPFFITGCFLKHLIDLYHLKSSYAKNQVKLSLAAYWLTFAPYLLLYLLPNLLFDQPLVSFRIVLFSALILPAAYLIGLLRYHMLGVDSMISRSAAYVLVMLFLTLLYVAFLSLAKHWFFGKEELSPELFLLFLLVIALIINPLVNRVQRLIDRFFFRYRPDDDLLLLEFSHTLATTLEFGKLVDLLTRYLPDQLEISKCALLLLTEQRSRLYPEHLRLGARPWPQSRMVAVFAQGRSFFFCQEPVKDPLLMSELRELGSAGFVLVLPLHGTSGLQGLFLIGPRKDGRIYREQDLRLFITLANQAALALTNSLQYSSLAKSKEQLEILFNKVVQKEKLAAIGEMSTTLAHEIRNPLGIIRSSAQYLSEGARSPEIVQEMLSYIMDEVDALSNIVSNILGVARFRNPTLQPLDLESEIPQLCRQWLESGDHRSGISLQWKIATRLPLLHADPKQLRQLLFNLLKNSEDALEDRGTIWLHVERQDDHCRLRLCDDGPGVKPEIIDRLFEKFYTTKKDGLGLGLTVCRQIVDAHHGTITIRNRKQGGAETVIHLPFQPILPLNKLQENTDAREDSDSGRRAENA